MDPITNLMLGGSEWEIQSMLVRLIDFLKTRQITALFTSLTSGRLNNEEQTSARVSSLIDTWILLRELESNEERNRGLYVIKSRGMAHSNQVREFLLTEQGVKLVPVYLGAEGVLTGSARVAQQTREKAEAVSRVQATEQRRLDMERRRKGIEAQIATLQAELLAEQTNAERIMEQDEQRVRPSKRTAPRWRSAAARLPAVTARRTELAPERERR